MLSTKMINCVGCWNSLLKQIGFQQEQQRKIYVLAVEIKQTHEVIGNALMMIRDENYTTAEIGYFLRPDHWNYFVNNFARNAQHVREVTGESQCLWMDLF